MNNKMNPSEMERLVSKLLMYKNELEINSKDIIIHFDNLINYYNTNNTRNLNNIKLGLDKSFIALNKINNDNIKELSKNINTFIDTDARVKNIFQNTDL